MTQNFRVSLAFAGYPGLSLCGFTTTVITCLTDNEDFRDLPIPLRPVTTINSASAARAATAEVVPPTDLTTLLTTLQAALAAQPQGGKQATAAKDEAQTALVNALRTEAAYIQSVASQSLSLLLSSGFEANSTNQAQSPLDTPDILSVDNQATTKLQLRVQAVDNAKSYQVRLSTGANVWVDGGVFTQARRIVLGNLIPGTTYSVQVRAVGGSTGFSDWSATVSQMAT